VADKYTMHSKYTPIITCQYMVGVSQA